ncbi:MAG: 3-dehydroquinate synthase [Prevotellaceae bacterium]|nr:3-dehydroquinate synthase [Prevotellaceae bacterium]
MQSIIFTNNAATQLCGELNQTKYDRLFILCDENTARLCLPRLKECDYMQNAVVITINADDTNKNLQSLTHVWQQLQQGNATRHSMLVNLGGGMVTDLGGFAASTFKRGIKFINIPTTLLSMVDASVGGKTGINFGGLKNEIGVFREAQQVIIDTNFLQTLDNENILSGYAEMIKHGLISNTADWAELLNQEPTSLSPEMLTSLLQKNIKVKERIVEADPNEQNLRKALNVGHTIGHALESLALTKGQPVLHGYAVAWGIICELYLCTIKTNFPIDKMRQTVSFIRQHYGMLAFDCNDYDQLCEFMTHDKKNTGSDINFTLLGDIGDIRLNQTATRNEIIEALDFFRDGM